MDVALSKPSSDGRGRTPKLIAKHLLHVAFYRLLLNQKILSLGQQVSKLTSLIRWPEYQERLSPYRVRAAETKSVLNNQIKTEHTQYLSVQRRPI